MNEPASTFVPIGTVMDALLIRIRKQMDERIAVEAAAKAASHNHSNTGAKASGSAQLRGVA